LPFAFGFAFSQRPIAKGQKLFQSAVIRVTRGMVLVLPLFLFNAKKYSQDFPGSDDAILLFKLKARG
jgi:hypothetical protein